METLIPETSHADVQHERRPTREHVELRGGGVHVSAEDRRNVTVERTGQRPLFRFRHRVHLDDSRRPRG